LLGPGKIEGQKMLDLETKSIIRLAKTWGRTKIAQPIAPPRIKASLVEKPLSCDSSSVGSLSMENSNRTLFTEYTYSDISIDIILQIKKEES
jgi:hypothetical protein